MWVSCCCCDEVVWAAELSHGELCLCVHRCLNVHVPSTLLESAVHSPRFRILAATSATCQSFCLLLESNTHPFNGPLSGSTWVSRYQKGKTNLDFTGARDSEWQWHQLRDMQVCTSLQTDNHARTSPLSFYRPDALPATQTTASKHWRHSKHRRHILPF